VGKKGKEKKGEGGGNLRHGLLSYNRIHRRSQRRRIKPGKQILSRKKKKRGRHVFLVLNNPCLNQEGRKKEGSFESRRRGERKGKRNTSQSILCSASGEREGGEYKVNKGKEEKEKRGDLHAVS